MPASTTLAAHKTIGPMLAPLQEQILAVVEDFGPEGCIGDDVRERLLGVAMKDGSLNTRYSELEDAGLIFRNGDTRRAKSGRLQLVMRHARFATSALTARPPKGKRNPFLEGMKHAARVVLSADPALSRSPAAAALRAELIKAAKRAKLLAEPGART